MRESMHAFVCERDICECTYATLMLLSLLALLLFMSICIYNFDFRGARFHHEDCLRPGADAGQGGNVTLPLSGRA